MIATALGFFTSIFVILALFNWISGKIVPKYPKFFSYVPPLVFLMLTLMCLSQFGLWDVSSGSAVLAARNVAQSVGIPFMVFLVTVSSDVKKLMKLGPRMLTVFVVTCISILIGIVVSAVVFDDKLNMLNAAGSWATITGADIGGPENLFAIADAMGCEAQSLVEAQLITTSSYSIWMTLLMTLIPAIAPKFNTWVKADMSYLDEMEYIADEKKRPVTPASIMLIIAVGLSTVLVSKNLGNIIGTAIGLNGTVCMYLLITVIGLLLGTFTNIGNYAIVGSLTGTVTSFFLMLCFIGFDLSLLAQAGWYFLASWTVMLFHIVIMVIYAKLTRTDIYSMACASIATFGGNSSAPVVAACYGNKIYITIGCLMASLGVIVGTVAGLGVGQLLLAIL